LLVGSGIGIANTPDYFKMPRPYFFPIPSGLPATFQGAPLGLTKKFLSLIRAHGKFLDITPKITPLL
jgi:hypothetical protein